MLSRIIKLSFILIIFSLSVISASAEDITADVMIEGIDKGTVTDKSVFTSERINGSALTLESKVPMKGVYIKFSSSPKGGLLNGETQICTEEFLHTFVELSGALSADLFFSEADICEMQIFSMGELPGDVQLWECAPDGVDLMLISAHSDDDQLFFAGLLPLYTSKDDVRVAVAYFINHYDTKNRTHELLDGLWHCGVRIYPEISPFPDGYSESAQEARNFLYSKGFSDSDFTNYHKYLLEKYKPQTVVLHDFHGEYGHGAHMLATESFVEVLNSDFLPLPSKVYVHLYPENSISLDIDTPLEAFDGKTAFNISQEAFGFHTSQHWAWFYSWIYGKNNSITAAHQIRSYNPASYGLYYSSVGEDSGNDILENIVLYNHRELTNTNPEEVPTDNEEKNLSSPSKQIKQNATKPLDKKASGKNSLTYLKAALVMCVVIIFFMVLIRKKK